MLIQGLNHLAFITDDMTKTVRFYRDLLGMKLQAGVGHDGFRHYFFQMGTGQVAFFEYEGASPMKKDKFHGERTSEPIGFDHVSFTVESKEALFALKDKLVFMDIHIDPDEHVYPMMVAPNGAMKDMWLSKTERT